LSLSQTEKPKLKFCHILKDVDMAITVEGAFQDDLERLYEIERQCFVEEAFTKKQISQLLSDYNSLSLIAREGPEIVGFIIAVICPGRKANRGHVVTIDVSPSQRRRGTGTMLLKEMERIFKSKFVDVSFLEVREDNVAALSLYRKLGYKRVGKLENYYKTAHGICLKKTLA
jgi:ribosomal-protein-alanine N-acetyltransferase